MNIKMSILITMFLFVLLGAICIWFWGEMNQKNDISLENQVESNHNDLLLSWEEINQWKSANKNTFKPSTKEPYVLYKNKQNKEGILFVQNGELKFVFESNKEMKLERLLSFDEVTDQMHFWIHNQTILMGGERKERYSDGDLKPAWYGISFSSEEGGPSIPKVFKISELNYLADQVLTMTYVIEPNLFFMVLDGNSSFREIIYQPGTFNFEYVNNEFQHIREDNYNDFVKQYDYRKPQAQETPVDFNNINKYHFPENNTDLFTFEDERGTIVYYKKENRKPYIKRFVDFKINDFKMIFDANNKSYPFGHFTDPNDKKLYILPTENEAKLHSNSLLWDSNDWRLIRPHYDNISFYKIDNNELQIIRYNYNHRDDTFKDESISYVIKDAKFIKQYKTLLEFELKDETKHLSLYDLSKNVLPLNEQINKNHSMWVHDLNIQMEVETNIKDKSKADEIEVNLPINRFKTSDESQIPKELKREELFKDESGDIISDLTIKNISNEWHIIRDNILYKLQGEKLNKIGELPISKSYFVLYGSAVVIYTANDFTKIENYWIIADTYGNRIIKLNKKLEIISQYALNLPEKISVNDDGSIQIESIEGYTLLDDNLNFLSQNSKNFQTFEEGLLENRNIETDLYYHDLENDMIWIYDYGLFQHKPGTQQFRNLYIGHRYADHAKTRILSYKKQVIILFDNRVILFDKSGNWANTIFFPRDDKTYRMQIYGESSYYLDEEDGIIYLLQDYRVLQINLETNKVKTIFHQNYNNLGNLLYKNNKLYFSVHSSPSENELIIYNLNDGDFIRVKIEPEYYTNQIINEPEPKLIFADQFDKSWKSILLEDLE
ncbi:hypothetical protein [Chengkuizengella marina]|uniref:Uncharacterized protein n=1 Tax=Chengkuizengella marina TaxID=2507566 RepID=A0A6N9Q6E6_9BACL|nr:hypothetical protein [Chengkuizengella marina]NBI30426.1 hypothetical protein [Chengkuizengella marina]